MKICPKCNITHEKDGKFCSRSCANSRQHSEETKRKQSKATSKYNNLNPRKINKITKICIICTNEFLVYPCKEHQKTCSKICADKSISISNKGKTGGYQEGSGRSISGYYNNIYCGSTYELIWVMYNIAHNISFKKFEGYIEYNSNKKYFPDFIIDNTIYEIKGYHTDTVTEKANAAIKAGYDIKVLYKEDLKPMFDWFKLTYPNKKPQELYQDYRPKYTYICNTCNVYFSVDKQRNTRNVFCSRSCSGKYLKLVSNTGLEPVTMP